MSNARPVLPSTSDFGKVKSHFMELYGSTAVMNTYLKVALVCLGLVCLGLTALTWKIYDTARHTKPLVIRIDEVGRATAVHSAALDYQPQANEIKYFLIQFVQQHYGRMRATMQENYARSLYFLDGRLAHEVMEKSKKDKLLEATLSGVTEELDVHVKNVSIEDLRKPPYRATVDYEKVYFVPGTRQEAKREKFVGSFLFVVTERIANNLVPVNPLGLTITYFREDQAFN